MASDRLRAERDENQCRKDFTPSELAALGRQLEELERPKATGLDAELVAKIELAHVKATAANAPARLITLECPHGQRATAGRRAILRPRKSAGR